VERLLLFVEGRNQISTDDVLAVVSEQQAVDDDWAVVNAIGDGNAARALAETGLRLDRGDSPHQLLGQLRWWVSNKLAPAAPGRVKPALEALLRTDLALKSSGGDDRVLLERLVVELTGRPIAQGRWR
jgi:DNA polymerase III delta subunit